MTISLLSPLSSRGSALVAPFLLAFALAAPASVRAAAEAAQPPSLSEKAGAAFSQLGKLNEAKDWNGMLAVLDAALPTLEPQSFDVFKILDMKAKLYGQLEQNGKAVEAWSQALAISDAKHFYDAKELQMTLLFLAQFSYTEGSTSKVPAVQQQYSNRAAGYFKRYLQNEKKPSPDIQMFYASLIYNQAVADPAKLDTVMLQQASDELQKALYSAVHPKEAIYVLLLAILQQQNNVARSADILEYIVQQNPTKKDYWTSLSQTYLALAGEKDLAPEKVRQNYIRAINTIERAQALGFMATPKDNLYLVNLYLIAGQFSKGTQLLHKGLKSGTIDSEVKNWLALGYYYQQANDETTAIAALKESAKLFPTNGQIDVTIAEIYRTKDLFKEARDYYRIGLNKGNLEKPQIVLAYLANAAFTIEELDEAKAAVEEAYAKYPADAAKDKYLPQLKAAIDSAIADRDAQKTKK